MFLARARRWMISRPSKPFRCDHPIGLPLPCHLDLEILEDRRLLSTLLVANTNDNGANSLRQALSQANNGDSITFAPGLVNQSITLTSGALVIQKDVSIVGLGANQLTVHDGANSTGHVFFVDSGARASIAGLTIADGKADQGGGVFNEGFLTLSACTLRDNEALGDSGLSSGMGGGVFNAGSLTIIDCTFAGNQAIGHTGGGNGEGGGLANDGGASADILNSTFSGNQAIGGTGGTGNDQFDPDDFVVNDGGDGLGGAIFNNGGALSLTNDTIAGNQALAGAAGSSAAGPGMSMGGGIFQRSAETDEEDPDVDIRNTILAGNSAASDADVHGTFHSHGHNLIQNPGNSQGFGAPGDLLNVDPLLRPLQDNGGPTLTRALLPGSPAIDAGDNSNITLTTDQRGFQRFVNNTIDIGAFEFQPAASVTLTSSANPSVFGETVTFTATLVPVPQSNTPGGTVTFFDGEQSLGTVALDGLTASLSTASLAAGSHTITAVYGGDALFSASTSPALVQVVNQPTTSLALSASPNPSVFGQPVSFNAIVTANNSDLGAPTGTVLFSEGETFLGTGTLQVVNGMDVATFTPAGPLAIGAHVITATYTGDDRFAGVSATITETVNQDATTTLVSASPAESVFGEAVTITATVGANAPGMGTPTGTVTFSEGGTTLATESLSNGSASFSTTALAVGGHTITASYSGDGNFLASSGTSETTTATVVQDATTTTVTASPATSVFGQDVTFTANVTAVTPGAGTPTGTVIFSEGTTQLGSATLDGGQAVFHTTALGIGSHTITASYSGDTNFKASSGTTAETATPTVVQDATATALNASPNPSIFGQDVLLSATVRGLTPGSGTPTGTVTFMEGTSVLGTGVLSNGSASFHTASLGAGNHLITASYSGDANFSASSSSTTETVNLTINPGATSTIVSAAPATSVFGQEVTFTASVTRTSGAGTPTGTITFKEGAAILETEALINGSATLNTTALAVGGHTITAFFSGDANFSASSGSAQATVNRDPSAATLGSAPMKSTLGQEVVLTASVGATAPGAGTPTGSISFMEGTVVLGTETLHLGQAVFQTSALTAGSHTITAQYNGDGNFSGGSASVTLTVNGTTPPVIVQPQVTPAASTVVVPAIAPSVPAIITSIPTPASQAVSITFIDETFISPPPLAPPTAARVIPMEGRPLVTDSYVPAATDSATRTTPFRGSNQQTILQSPSTDSQSSASQSTIEVGGGAGKPSSQPTNNGQRAPSNGPASQPPTSGPAPAQPADGPPASQSRGSSDEASRQAAWADHWNFTLDTSEGPNPLWALAAVLVGAFEWEEPFTASDDKSSSAPPGDEEPGTWG